MAVRQHEWQHPVRRRAHERRGYRRLRGEAGHPQPHQCRHLRAGAATALDVLAPGEHMRHADPIRPAARTAARTIVYPMHEPWLDVGRADDLERAQSSKPNQRSSIGSHRSIRNCMVEMKKRDLIGQYKLPAQVRFCKKCTVSNQRPRITFDEHGVCSACRFAEYKRKHVDWDARERELIELCDRHRKSNGDYDVIVPCSGGKDGGFVAHQLKYKYGMNPLTVTWAPLKATDHRPPQPGCLHRVRIRQYSRHAERQGHAAIDRIWRSPIWAIRSSPSSTARPISRCTWPSSTACR